MKKLGILEKINSTHENLRTKTMDGMFEDFPKVGEQFIIFGEGLKFGNRMIYTTPVKEIFDAGRNKDNYEFMVFTTANSTYKITVTGEVEEEAAYLEANLKIPETNKSVQ